MFWLQQGMGTRGIGPGNRAFLEHGSYSASCVNGRLPFHTTMKNHKFQHFSGNNPRVPDGLSVSQSASLSESQKHADKLADCVRLADGLVTFVTEAPWPNVHYSQTPSMCFISVCWFTSSGLLLLFVFLKLLNNSFLNINKILCNPQKFGGIEKNPKKQTNKHVQVNRVSSAA